jgi:hypothetical protein
MLINSSADQSASATIEATGKSVIQLDPLSGEITQIQVGSKGKKVFFQVDLEPVGSSLYFISLRSSSLPYANPTRGEGMPVLAENEVRVTADQDNVLVLNYLDLNAGKLHLKDSYFMDALLALFEYHGLEMGNPWQHKIQYRREYVKRDTFSENSGFEVSYHFQISRDLDHSSCRRLKPWLRVMNSGTYTSMAAWFKKRKAATGSIRTFIISPWALI